MSRTDRERHYIDVIERVLGGVQVTSGAEPDSRVTGLDSVPRAPHRDVRNSSVLVSRDPDDDLTSGSSR